jgi:hypothetical protein
MEPPHRRPVAPGTHVQFCSVCYDPKSVNAVRKSLTRILGLRVWLCL